MVPVSGGGGGATTNSETVQTQNMWPFSPHHNQQQSSQQQGTPSSQLHFMPRFNVPTGNSGGGGVEFEGGRGGAGGLQLGSSVYHQPSQHIGLAVSDSNLGMLAALNAYTRAAAGHFNVVNNSSSSS
ncbi:TCP family transcription factor-like protein, partial [Trifolium medium]|nr:TCP family transcription factor-like protein [Trifolium medium]